MKIQNRPKRFPEDFAKNVLSKLALPILINDLLFHSPLCVWEKYILA
jgi:hypothetical protein